jgi:hypothetical protein
MLNLGVSWRTRIKVIISGTGEYTQRINQLEKSSLVDLKFLNPSPEATR